MTSLGSHTLINEVFFTYFTYITMWIKCIVYKLYVLSFNYISRDIVFKNSTKSSLRIAFIT